MTTVMKVRLIKENPTSRRIFMSGWNPEQFSEMCLPPCHVSYQFYVDGNGRLHRYIIHHILAKMNYTQQGMIFPISASILNHVKDYNKVLDSD